MGTKYVNSYKLPHRYFQEKMGERTPEMKASYVYFYTSEDIITQLKTLDQYGKRNNLSIFQSLKPELKQYITDQRNLPECY